SIMCAGGVLSYLVLIPAIKIFASGIVPPGTMPIADMTPDDVRDAYVLYIGAGAVAAGGIISLLRSLPTIWHGLRAGLGDVRRGGVAASGRGRTEQDMSMKVVGIGIVVLMALILAFHKQLHMNLL